MGKSTASAMTYEDIMPLPKNTVRKLGKQTDITKMDTANILMHLFGRHWKFLSFLLSISLNAYYFVVHFQVISTFK